MKKIILASLTIAILAGCAANTQIAAVQPGTKVQIKTSANSDAPRSESYATTSFGNYEFQVTADGKDPFYGVLPLKFNGGYLALDILFFAPAAFFNLREVFPYYEFDQARGLIKYKRQEADSWIEYQPTPEEADRAKRFFEQKQL